MSLSYELDPERPALVVPDVHQDLGFLQRAVTRAEREGAGLLFLGDHVDAIDPHWNQPAALRAVTRALPELAAAHRHGCRFVVGNHDVQAIQAARHRADLLLAGDGEQVAKLDHALPSAAGYGELLGAWTSEFLRAWHIGTTLHGFVLTHAGVARRHWPWGAAPDPAGQLAAFLSETQATWEKWLRTNEGGPLFQAGPGRGGHHAPVGGPLWLDWDSEFVDDLPFPQIVGHTRGREPRRKDRSWCLDATQTCVGLLDADRGLRVLKI